MMWLSILGRNMDIPDRDLLEKALSESISSVEPLEVTDGGLHSSILIIRTIHNEYVLRIPKGGQGFCTRFVESHIDRSKWFDQRWATDLARELGVPAPKIMYSSRQDPRDSVQFVVMERLPGVPINDYGQWNGCPYDEKEFGEILRKLHAVEVSGAGPIDDFGDTYFASWQDFLNAMADRLMQVCLVRGGIDDKLNDNLQRHWLPHLSLLSDSSTRLLHLESLGFANILYNSQTRSITGFLDYEDCVGGDPLFEFAWMYYYYGHPASAQTLFDYDRFLSGYGNPPQSTNRIEIYQPFMWLTKLTWIGIGSDRAAGYRTKLRKICEEIA
jgi:aminoglycoside phosphotransferase (APT) family kinase protein